MDRSEESIISTKKPRRGARGVRKVKTGCLTCKIRHKKCDEAKPACSQCVSTGRTCDFLSIHRPLSIVTPQLHSFEAAHFQYFRDVCAPEFSLFFEMPMWGGIVFQAACTEPSVRHAALAIAALSRSRYLATSQQYGPISQYSLGQYNQAIRELSRLDASPQSRKLVVLTSIVFVTLEFLLENYDRVHIHLQSAFGILDGLITALAPSGQINTQNASDLMHLATSLSSLKAQATLFTNIQM